MTRILSPALFLVIAILSSGVAAQTNPVGDACPAITVTGPAGPVSSSEKMTFAATVSGGSKQITYNWFVSAGTIVSGQGTAAISVSLEGLSGGEAVTAMLQISDPGAIMPTCQTTASETGTVLVTEPPGARLGDEFRTAGSNCEEGFARMDAYLVELGNDPSASGVVIIYTEEADPRSGFKRRKQLMSFLAQRHFDTSRITFIDGPVKKNATTQFWLVPAGAKRPTPDEGRMPVLTEAAKPTKPYLFGAEHADGVPGCDGNSYDPEAYAAELRLDPTARGRVVISETSQARFTKKRAEILSVLKRDRIATSRVAFVFKKVRPRQLAEFIELWIVPSGAK